MAKKESKFLTELRDSFQAAGAFFYKISDMPHLPGMMRFDKSKPFDSFACYNGVAIAIEAKVLRDYEAFGLRHLRDCQIEGLTQFGNAGGSGFVFLNVRRNANKEEGIKRINKLFIFEWDIFAALVGTIKKNDLEKWPYIDGKKGLFDLKSWLSLL